MLIYLVSVGDYDEAYISAVFSREEDAKRYVDMLPEDSYPYIMEYDMDAVVPLLDKGHMLFFVSIKRDGPPTHITKQAFAEGTEEYLELVDNVEFNKASSTFQVIGKRLFGHVFAKDVDHAGEIAKERRTQLINSGEW